MYVHEALAASSAWANGRGFQNLVPNSVHTSSLHHIIDQAFPIFQLATLKNTGRPGYEASFLGDTSRLNILRAWCLGGHKLLRQAIQAVC